MSLADAPQQVASGTIQDGKTILLPQQAALVRSERLGPA